MKWTRPSIIPGLIIVCLTFGCTPSEDTARTQASPDEISVAAKRPFFAGTCTICPWGQMAQIIKAAMAPYGYDVQLCHHCGGSDGPRYMGDKEVTPPRDESRRADMEARGIIMALSPAVPPDFGVTIHEWLRWAYDGTHYYEGEGPRQNLRVIAALQNPWYLIAAATKESGITDLRQAVGEPVHVLVDPYEYGSKVLTYYGLTEESVTAAGGWIRRDRRREDRDGFDLIVHIGTLNNTPEFRVWQELSQKHDLTFLQLEEELLNQFVEEHNMERREIPEGFMRGVDGPIPTVASHIEVIYGRDELPDDFVYDVARAIDEHQDLLAWKIDWASYNQHTVWKIPGVPLHPGAERYYREKGYMP